MTIHKTTLYFTTRTIRQIIIGRFAQNLRLGTSRRRSSCFRFKKKVGNIPFTVVSFRTGHATGCLRAMRASTNEKGEKFRLAGEFAGIAKCDIDGWKYWERRREGIISFKEL